MKGESRIFLCFRCVMSGSRIYVVLACSLLFGSSALASSIKGVGGEAEFGQAANKTGVVPGGRIYWLKNPLVTRIKYDGAIVREDSIKIKYYLSYTNPSDEDVKWTGMPTPDGPFVRLYAEGNEILPVSPSKKSIVPYVPAPRDEEIRLYANVVKAHETWEGVNAAQLVIANSQLLPGTHIYEVVYWHSQLDWIDVREYLDRTDSQGKGRTMYPITDNAPSNRLYFKVYKPTEEEAKQGRHIEFLGEVDAKTQGPQFPFARPGDFAPRTGYWKAVGKSIDALGGYHETFVKEGDSMPNLPGKVGVDPFSFQWKLVGEQPTASSPTK